MHCKKWTVKVWTGKGYRRLTVYAPNRRFAHWNTKDLIGWKDYVDADKITISTYKGV